MNRKEQILLAVDNLIRVHDDWENDDRAPIVPTEAFEQALEDCVHIVCNGDIPTECREMNTAVSRLAVEWEDYRNLERVNPNGTPHDSMWAAYREIVQARRGAIAPVPRTLESVAQLREQKVPDYQIAKMYGTRDPSTGLHTPTWIGPFFDENGRIRHDQIDKEHKKPGSVLGKNWVHPDEISRVEKEKLELDTRLKRLESQQEQRDDSPYEDPASIADMLYEGAFPAQIAKTKKVSIREVLEVAKELEITPNDIHAEETWEDQKKGREEKFTPEQEELIKNAILIVHASDEKEEKSASDIAEAVMKTLELNGVTPQKVAAVLREHKRQSLQSVTA